MSARYAIYLSPDPASGVGAAGAEWLGRCAASGAPRRQPGIPGLAPALVSALTEAPRRYGFHATLKAPFRLVRGGTRGRLLRFMGEFAASRRGFEAPAFEVAMLEGFLALVPVRPEPRLDALASRCVVEFDRFRALLDDDEMARREAAGLNARQRALLERWGYPHVMEEFRLHYTLTGALAPYEEGVVERITGFAREHFAAVLHELQRVDALALFEEESPGEGFHLVERFALGAPARTDTPESRPAA